MPLKAWAMGLLTWKEFPRLPGRECLDLQILVLFSCKRRRCVTKEANYLRVCEKPSGSSKPCTKGPTGSSTSACNLVSSASPDFVSLLINAVLKIGLRCGQRVSSMPGAALIFRRSAFNSMVENADESRDLLSSDNIRIVPGVSVSSSSYSPQCGRGTLDKESSLSAQCDEEPDSVGLFLERGSWTVSDSRSTWLEISDQISSRKDTGTLCDRRLTSWHQEKTRWRTRGFFHELEKRPKCEHVLLLFIVQFAPPLLVPYYYKLTQIVRKHHWYVRSLRKSKIWELITLASFPNLL